MKFHPASRSRAAFTMVEIAICLAIIGVGLVAIIGVLPLGMGVQRENREETIINQDATVLMEAIRNGSRGMDDLTNYIYAITNYWTLYNNNGAVANSGVNGYTLTDSSITWTLPAGLFSITNGLRIVGLLSTPQYLDVNGFPTNNLYSGGYSNRVYAYVRSLSGLAVEKPPQNNDLMREDSFGYRLLCVNVPLMVDTNVWSSSFNSPAYKYSQALNINLHELRLTFLWPQLPNGNVGKGRQTFRALVAGQIQTVITNGSQLYFFQPQSFVNPNAP